MVKLQGQKAPTDTFCDRCETLICVGEQTVMVEFGTGNWPTIPERFCIGCVMEVFPGYKEEEKDETT